MTSQCDNRLPYPGVIYSLFVGLLLVSNQSFAQNKTLSKEVNVYAAASLRDAIFEVGSAFELEKKIRVRYNIAGSNVLAQQIVASPKADVYLSANQDWMDFVEKKKRLVPGSRKTLLSNRLVVVAHKSQSWSIKDPKQLASIPFKHLALADPVAVPAGKYAKTFMEQIKVGENKTLWQSVEKKVAPSLNVRAALALVESSPSIVGIVYQTDASSSKKIKVLFEVPDRLTPSIEYSVARVKHSNSSEASSDLYKFLSSKKAKEIFKKHGFVVAD